MTCTCAGLQFTPDCVSSILDANDKICPVFVFVVRSWLLNRPARSTLKTVKEAPDSDGVDDIVFQSRSGELFNQAWRRQQSACFIDAVLNNALSLFFARYARKLGRANYNGRASSPIHEHCDRFHGQLVGRVFRVAIKRAHTRVVND